MFCYLPDNFWQTYFLFFVISSPGFKYVKKYLENLSPWAIAPLAPCESATGFNAIAYQAFPRNTIGISINKSFRAVCTEGKPAILARDQIKATLNFTVLAGDLTRSVRLLCQQIKSLVTNNLNLRDT